jgi:hypothetical protein
MTLYEIRIGLNSGEAVTLYKEKNNPKAAYDYAKEETITIFGKVADTIRVIEPKPAT